MTAAKTYRVNEIFRTIHGEGVRAGIVHVFVRLAGCNLTCDFCDTEFESGVEMTAAEIVGRVQDLDVQPDGQVCGWVLLCGGEPLLQVDVPLIAAIHAAGYQVAMETNGTRPIPQGVAIDWITCSPKIAEHAIKLQGADELKYLRRAGQAIPCPSINARHKLISPVFDGDAADADNVKHCVNLVKANPGWRLTCQFHKLWGIL